MLLTSAAWFPWLLTYHFAICRQRLELMRVVYNDDLSPDTPEAKQDFFHCLTGCGNQNYFNFINLIPSRFVFIDVRLLVLSDVILFF